MATWRKVIVSGSSAVLNQISASGNIVPTSDNGADLGSSTLEWKDLYIDGTAHLDTANIAAGTITGITDLAVADGGTGASSFTDGGILLGSGTDPITVTAVLGDGEILIGDASGDPTTLDIGSSTAITTLGTIATGVWEGTTIAVDQGGTGATSLNNLITLGTHSTGNYISTITPGSGIYLDGASSATSTETATPTLSVDSGSLVAYYSSSVFSTLSGDISVTAAGVATVTGATTNAALTAGAGISAGGTFNGATARTFALDINELDAEVIATTDTIAFNDAGDNGIHKETVDDLFKIGPALVTEAAVAQGSDYILFLDGGSAGETKKESIPDFVDAINSTGIDASSGLLSVAAAQTSITSIINASLGKIGTAAAQEYITFGTSDEVNTFIDNSEVLSVRSGGVDVTGVLTVSSNATIEGNLVVNGDTTTLSTSNLQVGDAFIFTATGSAASNVDGGLIVQEGATADSGSALYHDTGDNRWSVAKSVAATATAVTPLQHVVTVSGSVSTNPNSTSGSYGIGEMWITDAEDIWVRTA